MIDAEEAIRTKLDVRDFDSEEVSSEIKLGILEAARLTQSGNNLQHWRFLIVSERENLEALTECSSNGGSWIIRAKFAIIVLTDPALDFHMIDAGRAVQDMQLAAWNHGVASGVYSRLKEQEFRKRFNVPEHLKPAIVVGFGYPKTKILGKKNRKPLSEIAFAETYGGKLPNL